MKNKYLYVLGSGFLIKLAGEMILGPHFFVSLGVIIFCILGLLVLLGIDLFKKKKIVEEPPVIEMVPVREDDVFIDLDRLMQDYHLELRIRRIGDLWQSTLLAHESGGVIRIVGMGSATSILDSLIKAEADFLEKTG